MLNLPCLNGLYGCPARIRTWVRGSKVPCATTAPPGKAGVPCPFTLRAERWHAQTVSIGAEGRSRTDTGLPPTVFETVASAIPPLRHETGSFIMRQFELVGRIRNQS